MSDKFMFIFTKDGVRYVFSERLVHATDVVAGEMLGYVYESWLNKFVGS